MYIFMYVCKFVCMYVCMQVCTCVCEYSRRCSNSTDTITHGSFLSPFLFSSFTSGHCVCGGHEACEEILRAGARVMPALV